MKAHILIRAVGFMASAIFAIAFILLPGVSGVAYAATPVTGPVSYESTETNAAGHLERDISKVVTEQRPDEFPLDTLLRSIRPAEKAFNVKVEYETVTYRLRNDAVNGAFTAAGTAADASVDLGVDSVNIWADGDTVYIPTINGGDSKPLRLLVMSVDRSGNTIKVTALNGVAGNTDRLPSIADNTVIYRGAPAWDEKKSQGDVITQLPTQDYNYTQIKAKTIERTQVEAKTRAYSGYTYQQKVAQQIYDLRSDCESQTLFGTRSKRLDTVRNEYSYTANGVTNMITNTLDFGTGSSAVDPSVNNILDMAEQVFADNAGSDKRILLCGKKVITGLDKITYDKNVEAMGTQIMHGISTKGLASSFGELYIKHSKMMDLSGWEDKAIVLDLENIFKHDLEPMHTKALDPDSSGTRRVQDSYRILENSCITLRYLDTHLIWQPAA